MYHVTITDSDGRVVSESEGKVLLLAHYISEDDGVLGLSLCNDGTIREQLCTIDAVETMRDKMMKDNPELTLNSRSCICSKTRLSVGERKSTSRLSENLRKVLVTNEPS